MDHLARLVVLCLVVHHGQSVDHALVDHLFLLAGHALVDLLFLLAGRALVDLLFRLAGRALEVGNVHIVVELHVPQVVHGLMEASLELFKKDHHGPEAALLQAVVLLWWLRLQASIEALSLIAMALLEEVLQQLAQEFTRAIQQAL